MSYAAGAGDFLVEFPTKLELVINLETSKAIRLRGILQGAAY